MAQPKPGAAEAPVRPVPLGRPPTYADVQGLPPHVRGEIVGGELYVLPRPRLEHSMATIRLGGGLDGPFGLGRGGPGGWWILSEPELHLEAVGRPIDPDLAGWRRERLPGGPRGPFATVAPDWVCEVLSPSTEAYDRGPKMMTYAAAGVPWAWLVDPDARTLEVYRNDGGTWRPGGRWSGEDRVRAEPFDAVELELGSLWG